MRGNSLITYEEAERFMARVQARDRYKDKELALIIANGGSLEEAAVAVGMDQQVAWEVARTPLFIGLVQRLRKERELAVYSPDADEAVEAEAASNYWTLRQIRDNQTAADRDRLKAALALHEARPKIRREKREEAAIKVVVIDGEVKGRLMEGLAKATGMAPEEVEAEFSEEREPEGKERGDGEGEGVV